MMRVFGAIVRKSISGFSLKMALCGAASVMAVSLSSSPAHAIILLDQSNDYAGNQQFGTSSELYWQQGITAAQSGRLSSVDLYFQDAGQVEFSLHGSEPWNTGASAYRSVMNVNAGWNSLDVSGANFSVLSGQQFSIGLHGAGAPDTAGPSFGGSHSFSDPDGLYDGGQLWSQFQDQYGRGTDPSPFGTPFDAPNYDMAFRTYVDTNSPAPDQNPSGPKQFGLFFGVRDLGGDGSPEFRGDNAATELAASFNSFSNSVGVAITGDRIDGNGISLNDISSQIANVKDNMHPGDTLFLYITGHGASLPGFGFGNELIVLGDDDRKFSFTDDILTSMLSGLSLFDKFVFLDSCFSGGFWGSGDLNEILDDGDLENLSKVNLLASASEYRVAYFDSNGLPLTSLGLLNAWSVDQDGYRVADYNEDGVISPAELYLAIGAYMQGRSGETVFEMGLGDKSTLSPSSSSLVQFSSSDFTGNITASVPEPSTWAMMIFGFGAIGVRIRKSRKSNDTWYKKYYQNYF